MGVIPSKIGAGVTFRAVIDAPHYPAPAWSLTLIARGPSQIDLVARHEEEGHVLEATASLTAAWGAGNYSYVIRAASGDDVYQLEAGAFAITPDLAALGGGHDPREHAQKVLDAIEAVIESRATIDQQSYMIGNRSLQRTPIADLLQLRTKYRAEVAAKKSARSGRSSAIGRTFKVRMT